MAEIRRVFQAFEEQYTQVPNSWLRDERVSRKARALAAEILSHRIGWRVTTDSLVRAGSEGRDAVRAGLRELEEAGYLVPGQERAEDGKFGATWLELRDPFAGSTAAGLSGTGKPATKEDHINKNTNSKEISMSANVVRDDVEGLLDLLDKEISANGVRKLPARNQTNRNAMRLLLDRDGFSEEEVAKVIRWAQADQFWHANILSASKLRDKIETLRGQMERNQGRNAAQSPASRALAVDLGGNSIQVANAPQIGVSERRAIGPSIIGEMNQGTW